MYLFQKSRYAAVSSTILPTQRSTALFALYLDVKARFEPITYQKTIIDTDQPLEQSVRQAIAGPGVIHDGLLV